MKKEFLKKLTNTELIEIVQSCKQDHDSLEYLLENLHAISWEFDLLNDKFNYISSNAKIFLGYGVDEWTDFKSWQSKIYSEDREEVAFYVMNETSKGRNHFMEYRMIKKNLDIIWIQNIITVGKDDNNNIVKLYGFILNVDEQKKASLQIAEEHLFTQTIINNIPDPVMVIKDDYSISLMNNKTKAKLKDIKILNPLSPKCYEVSHHRSTPCDGNEHPCPLQEVLETSKATTVVHNHIEVDGSSHYVELSATPLFNDANKCIGIIESARDITSYVELTDKLREKSDLLNYQAHHDSLTNLPNRVLFNDRLEQAILSSKRSKKLLALLFIDLDHFKNINDTLGHHIGDDVLREVSKRIKTTIRDRDTLSRLGGDEFTIIMEGIEHVEYASILSSKIIKALKKPLYIEEHKLYISCSLGISIYPSDTQVSDDLIKYADIAMYKAKDMGRNNFQYYSKEMTEFVVEKLSLEAKLRNAIQKKEFVLHYQPQYNGRTKELVGLEALIRWQNDEIGMIPPIKFIPLAEESDLIIEIDNWVMQEAMRTVSLWHKDGLNPGVLSLNLAMKQLESDNYLSRLQDMMSKYDFKASWLKLEILERNVMNNPEETMLKLKKLKKLGVSISIDDFGTGYSSLAYLKRFEINELKIDRSFVTDVTESEEGRSIVKAIIALSQALNIKIIAEGVETKEELDFMIENNCYYIQGYYFSKPLSSDKIKKLLFKDTNLKMELTQ